MPSIQSLYILSTGFQQWTVPRSTMQLRQDMYQGLLIRIGSSCPNWPPRMYGMHLQLSHYLKIMPSTIPNSWSLVQATKTTSLLMPWLHRTHVLWENGSMRYYCDKCMRTFPYGNSLYKIKAVATNGLKIGLKCISLTSQVPFQEMWHNLSVATILFFCQEL